MADFRIIDAEQRSPEWFAARLGKLTGSVAADILATVKTGEAAARRNLRIKLALERITKRSLDKDFVSAAMQDGVDREADARTAFELETGSAVFTTGFLEHETLMAGASLDGHLGNFAALVSIKCRQPAAHLEFLTTGEVPASARAQMAHECWITGATEHCYIEYNPDFPPSLQLKWLPLTRAQLNVDAYAEKALAFLAEVTAETVRILELAKKVA